MYDVIVIGAGPTGCVAAKILAEKGYKILLVEKCKMPRYKSCSGILIKKSMELVECYFDECVPPSVMCSPTENKGMIFTDDKGKEYRFEQEGANVWRSSFDNWLAIKAEDCGVEIKDSTMAISCEEMEDRVRVTLHNKENYSVETKYVIDCEGVTGLIKRKLLNNMPAHITTYQTFNEGRIDLDSHYFYAYLQPELSEYDAWFNIKDNFLVFGVAVKDVSKIRDYYNRFISYMETYNNLHIFKQVKEEKWLMPRIGQECKIDYGIGRVIFAGEIAGFLNPMGEGISAGMESAYNAASAIESCFDFPEKVRTSYEVSTRELRGYMQRQWNLVAGMAETFKIRRLYE